MIKIKHIIISTILIMLTDVAQADLCDPNWWRDSATESSVSMMVQAQDQDVDAVCPNTADGDYPIHLAVFFANNVEAVEALIQAGASMARSNAIRQTPATLLDIRLNAAVTSRMSTDVILGIEQLVNQGTAAQNLAQNNLCDLGWWPSATRASVVNAINQGADPNQDCDEFGNKPIHIALDLNVLPYPLSNQNFFAFAGLIEDGDVIPDARAVRLIEDRYTRTKIIVEEAVRADREGRMSQAEFNQRTAWEDEVTLYTAIRAYAGVESYENARARTTAEMNAIVDRVYNEPLPPQR